MQKDLIENSFQVPGYLSLDMQAQDQAVRYQQWIMEALKPFIGEYILELGAGVGHMSRWFKAFEHLVLVDNDKILLDLLKLRKNELFSNPSRVDIKELDVEKDSFDQFKSDNFDTLISFNMLEHIQNDLTVLQKGADLLRHSKAKGIKRMITFVPAHGWAYGNMDKAVGHFRRYNRTMLKELHKQCASDATLILKSFNLFALWGWIINGRILKRTRIGSNLAGVFEKFCPFFKVFDNLILSKMHIPLGNSLIAIQEWR